MANNFKGYEVVNITTETIVYTGAANTQATVIGFSVANTTGLPTLVSVKKNSAFMVKDAPVPSGSSLVVIGGDQKVAVEPTDTLSVISDQNVDVVLSTLEIV